MEAHQKLGSTLGIHVIEEYESLIGAAAVDRIARGLGRPDFVCDFRCQRV